MCYIQIHICQIKIIKKPVRPYDVTSYRTVVNTMEYHNLRKKDLGAKFVCQGSNTNSTPPVSREIHVSLYCKT